MKLRILACTFTVAIAVLAGTTTAQAFCGTIQESAAANTVNKARKQATRKVNRAVQNLRRQHGAKLVLEAKGVACLGGGVGIDANGNPIKGKPSCQVTQPFCVNP